MEQAELLKVLVGTLEKLGVPYLLTGSLATSAFGEPRFTHDIDVVVRLTLAQVPHLCAAFSAPDYYCDQTAAEQAVRQCFQFNILHPASGQKVDVIVATDSEFDRTRLASSRWVRRYACHAPFTPLRPENVNHPEHGSQGFEEEVPDRAAGWQPLKGDLLERGDKDLVAGDPLRLVRQQVTPARVRNQHGGQNERRREAKPGRDLRARNDEEEQRTSVDEDLVWNNVVEDSSPCGAGESQDGGPPQALDYRFRRRKRG